MFQSGRAYKVKVETASGEVGFGRATIIGKEGNKLFVQLRTSKDANHVLPKHSRLLFVGDSPNNPFNGLWSTTVTGARIVGGKTVMECSAPKFEPLTQRRGAERFPMECPVEVADEEQETAPELVVRNISRSGIGLEAGPGRLRDFPMGETVDLVVHSQLGDIQVRCKVVRAEHNWLANRNVIGLEFAQLSDEAEQRLDELLDGLAKKTSAPETPASISRQTGELSKWMRTTTQNMRLVKAKEHERSEQTKEPDEEESS